MTLINPFVPFTDLEPLQYRRQPLGEKAGMFFYNTDEEQAQTFVRCGGVIYPTVTVTSVAECTLVDDRSQRNEDAGHHTLHSSTSSSNSSLRSVQHNNSTSYGRAYAPALSSSLKTLVNWIPALSYFTYRADTAAQLTHTPGKIFFRLGKDSPIYKNFTASRFSAQAIAFHPYFPILAVAEQRSPLETAMIRFYDVGNGSFLEKIVLTHPKLRGVTELVWKPHSKDVLAVGVFGGVMVWSIPALTAAVEANMASKANGKISLLRGGSSSVAIKGRGSGSLTSHTNYANTMNDQTTLQLTSPTAGVPPSEAPPTEAAAPNSILMNHSSLSVKKRPLNELSHIFGANKSAKAAAAGLGAVNWSVAGTHHLSSGTLVEADQTASDSSSLAMHNTTLNPSEVSAGMNNRLNNSTSGISAFIPDVEPPAAFFITYDFTSEIPVTTVAFSEVSGALMAVASRGSPDTYIHNVGCRPKDSLLTILTGYSSGMSSNVSCLMFSMDDSFLMRGYESASRLSITNIASLQTRHFVTPAPIIKIVRVESIGFNVFALMLKGAEAITIVHVSVDTITILANVVTGEHGETPIGGEVLDIACSSYNLYARVSSGHILVFAVTGCVGKNGSSLLLKESEIEARIKNYGKHTAAPNQDHESKALSNCQIGVFLKGGIPVPRGNRHVVKIEPFQNFTGGALLAVANGELGTVQFVPSYFTRSIDADNAL